MFDKTIKDSLKIAERMDRPVYRGQAKAKWKVKSGAVRHIEKAYDINDDDVQLMELIRAYQKEELIDPLKLMGHSHQDDESARLMLERFHANKSHGFGLFFVSRTFTLLESLSAPSSGSSSSSSRKTLDCSTPLNLRITNIIGPDNA